MVKKLYMKYLVLKMNDRIDLLKLYNNTYQKGFSNPKVSEIAEIIINCLQKEK